MNISKKTEIILYGASAMGIIGYNSLSIINNFNVVGFIDKRAGEINEQFGLPVWDIDKVPIDYNERHKFIVVVCVKNVFDHKDIVVNLQKIGFRYFIFKQVNMNIINENIEINYSKIFNDNNIENVYELDEIDEMVEIYTDTFNDNFIINSNDNTTLAYVPLPLVFCNSKVKLEDETTYHKSLYSLYPHIELYKFFHGNGSNYRDYIQFCEYGAKNTSSTFGGEIKITEKWKENVLRNRKMIDDEMTNYLENNSLFFINNAPFSKFSKNKFLMNSGKNRAAFLLSNNRKYIPLEMRNNEYSKYFNINVARKLKKYYEDNNIRKVKVPILHPLFSKLECERKNYYELFVSRVIMFLHKHFNISYFDNKKIRLKILDMLNDNGAMSRIMSLNYFIVDKMVVNSEKLNYLMLLNELFYVDNINYCSNSNYKIYDAIIVETDDSRIIRQLSNKTNVLIILSTQKNLIEQFERVKLFSTYWDNKILEANIYVRIIK